MTVTTRSETRLSPQQWAARYRADDGEQQPISVVERCFGLETQRKRHGLELMRPLLAALGNPQLAYPVVHITGSKGKGSTAAMIAAILQAYGLRVGLYISPSLTHFEERIQVNGAWIEPQATARYVTRLRQSLQSSALPPPKFFEAATAVAFLHFRDSEVDVAVVEVGIGGRRDATNVVHAEVAVLTTIELEHTAILGSSLGAIAKEKAGIIKPGSWVVSGVELAEARQVVLAEARSQGAQLLELEREFDAVQRCCEPTWQRIDVRLEAGWFPCLSLQNVPLRLPGCYQARNAALAVAASQLLLRRIGRLEQRFTEAVHRGLGALSWPGRLELCWLQQRPVLLDVAHTPGSMEQLVEYVTRFFANRRVVVVLGLLRDKPLEAIAAVLSEIASEVCIAPVKWYRTAEPASVAAALESYGVPTTRWPSIRRALQAALERTTERDLIVLTGSVFAVGEAKRAYGLEGH